MTLGSPWGLLALAVLAPLVAAYFLRRRQRPRTVSALFLWRSPDQRAQAGPRWRRFARELSLLLEALAVVASALYLADLRLGSSREGRALVVVVDGSLSMAARPGGVAVSELARAEVAKAAHEAGADLLTVVEAGVRPRVLAGPREELTRALGTLERWQPRGAGFDWGPSLTLARELAGHGQRVVWVTDGPAPAALALPPVVELRSVGRSAENVAFVAARRSDEAGVARVMLRVANFSGTERQVKVSLRGSAADSARPGGATRDEVLHLPPGGSAMLRATFPNTAALDVRLPEDALAEDGQLTLLPAPARAVVLSLEPGLGPAAAEAVSRFAKTAQGAVVLAPPGAEADLVVGAAGCSSGLCLGIVGAPRSFVGPFFAAKDSPLLEDVGLAGVTWTAGQSPPGRALLSAGDVVLVSEEEDSGRLHLNLELARSSLQRTPAWPVLLGNVARQARERSVGFSRKLLVLGEALPLVVGDMSYAIDGPEGLRPVLAAGRVMLPAPGQPGRYRLLRAGAEVDAAWVLPIDEHESDLRDRGEGIVEAQAPGELLAAGVARRRPAWPLWLVLAFLLLDFWLTSRT